MKQIRRTYLETKIKITDNQIEYALKYGDFLLAQELEAKLTYLEGQLLATYNNTELDGLTREGYPA